MTARGPTGHPPQDQLLDLALGTLGDYTQDALAPHLEGCPECQTALDTLRREQGALRQALQGGASADAAAVVRAVEERLFGAARRARRRARAARALAALAVTATALGGGWRLTHPPGEVVLAGLLALAADLDPAPPGEAGPGLVILTNGRGIVGQIERDGQDLEVVDPEGASGRIRVRGEEVRWCDPAAAEPTFAYWERFADRVTEPRWEPSRRRWELAGQVARSTVIPVLTAGPDDPLALLAVGDRRLALRPPLGWLASRRGGLTIVSEPRDPGRGGAPARLALGAAPPGPAAPQARWERVLAWLEARGEQVTGQSALRPRPGGAEALVQTATGAGPTRRVTLRRLVFLTEGTYVAQAVFSAAEAPRLEPLLRRALASLRTAEE